MQQSLSFTKRIANSYGLLFNGFTARRCCKNTNFPPIDSLSVRSWLLLPNCENELVSLVGQGYEKLGRREEYGQCSLRVSGIANFADVRDSLDLRS